jgi:hypothetical protein
VVCVWAAVGLSVGLVACTDAPSAPSPPPVVGPPPPPPQPASYTLSGVVFESTAQGVRPVHDGLLDYVVELPGGGLMTRVRTSWSDAGGRYGIPDLPPGGESKSELFRHGLVSG